MTTRKNRTRRRFELESLEGRVALSHMGAVVEDGPHHHRGGHAAEIHTLRHGADDPANHDAADDKNAAPGADDPANHDANDDNGGAANNNNNGNTEAVHHHRRGRAVAAQRHHGGAEHPAGHR